MMDDENSYFSLSFYIRLFIWFLIWTLAEYLIHRFMHFNHKLNIFYRIHRYHHSIPYDKLTSSNNKLPKLSYFFLWFDNINETIEIILGETIPAIGIYLLDKKCGFIILIFHYFYELIATDALLEHNPNIKTSSIINYFAVGQFHLEHHRKANKNFGFTITLWDHLFGTYETYNEDEN